MLRVTLSLALAVVASACFVGRRSQPRGAPAPDVAAQTAEDSSARDLPAADAPRSPEETRDALAREREAMSRVEANLDTLRRQRGAVEGAVGDIEGRPGGRTSSGARAAAARAAAAVEGEGDAGAAPSGRERTARTGTLRVAAGPVNAEADGESRAGAARALDAGTHYFDANSALLSDAVQRRLVEQVEIMRAYPSFRLSIIGHADDGGDDDENQALSEQRADAVRQFFIARGIEEQRVRATGLGRQEAVTSAQGEGARRLNRRVEFDVRW